MGIKINTLSKNELHEKLERFLNNNEQNYFVTVNPEIILRTQEDEEYFYIVNHSTLNLPDGIGLKLAACLLGFWIQRITGVDLTFELLKLAETKKIKVAVVNWKGGLSRADDISNTIKNKFPALQFIVIDIDREWNMPFYKDLQLFQPQIIFSSLGFPYQEKWIFNFLKKASFVKIAIGVGGTFDFLSGKIKRAPKIIRAAGFEWLWRLIKQPHRWRRIYNATVVFTVKFLIWRFILPYLYRPNVACMLYKKETEGYKILLVERQDWPGHWQLPQGGMDGMSTEEAGTKELSEEINNHDFRPIKSYNDLWKYEFRPKSNYDNLRHNGYKGQKQGLFVAQFFGKDEEIKINYWDHSNWKWVKAEDLINEVHERRKESAKIYLEKFNSLKNNLI